MNYEIRILTKLMKVCSTPSIDQKLYLKAGTSIPNDEDKDVMFLFKL